MQGGCNRSGEDVIQIEIIHRDKKRQDDEQNIGEDDDPLQNLRHVLVAIVQSEVACLCEIGECVLQRETQTTRRERYLGENLAQTIELSIYRRTSLIHMARFPFRDDQFEIILEMLMCLLAQGTFGIDAPFPHFADGIDLSAHRFRQIDPHFPFSLNDERNDKAENDPVSRIKSREAVQCRAGNDRLELLVNKSKHRSERYKKVQNATNYDGHRACLT